MTLSEIAILVAAGAWLPQIGRFIYWLGARPKINVYAGRSITISSLGASGTFLVANCAILAERKDVTITKINVGITHEDGQKRTLEWFHMYEEQGKITAPSGQLAQNLTRDQAAIILRLPVSFALQTNIAFTDLKYEIEYNEYLRLLQSEKDLLIKNGKPNIKDKIFASQTYDEMLRFYENHQFWKVGSYSLSFIIHTDKLKKPHIQRFKFALGQNDVDMLSKNRMLLEEFVMSTIFPEHSKGDPPMSPKMNYASVLIYPIN